MRYLLLKVEHEYIARLHPKNYRKANRMLIESDGETTGSLIDKVVRSLKLIGIKQIIVIDAPYILRGIYLVNISDGHIYPLSASDVNRFGIADLVEACQEIPSGHTYWRFKKIL